MRSARSIPGMMAMMLLVYGCIEPYDPPLNSEDISLLVIDGFLNVNDGKGTVTVSRTLPVKSEELPPAESGAFVRIEDEHGLIYPLTEISAGVYEGPVSAAASDSRYRLVVTTRLNDEYVSDYVTPFYTPQIDSITYSIVNEGVEFQVTTHDPSNTTQNYRWTFLETYQYNARYNSLFRFEGNDIVFRPPSESIFTCWRTNRSTDIMIGSTKRLASSVMSKYPLTFIPQESIKLSVKYSLLVQQQALSDEAYEYWLGLERSTENLGGLFDPLPSDVPGNIRSISDPNETVIGYFDAGTIVEQRVFLNRRELPKEMPGYRGDAACMVDSVFLPDVPQLHPQTTMIVDAIYVTGAGLVGYTVSTIGCTDCRVLGGTTMRPTFWK